MTSSSSKTIGTVAIGIGVVVFLVLFVLSILGSLAFYGFRRYIARAKEAEGRVEVSRLAESIRACSVDLKGGLPETTKPVPPSLADVSGKKYVSRPEDWDDRAYKCGAFSISTPQYFQYQWQIVTPSSGRAIAQADIDGDGKAEIRFERLVTCVGEQCSVDSLVQK
jgi:hypothetical protein